MIMKYLFLDFCSFLYIQTLENIGPCFRKNDSTILSAELAVLPDQCVMIAAYILDLAAVIMIELKCITLELYLTFNYWLAKSQEVAFQFEFSSALT